MSKLRIAAFIGSAALALGLIATAATANASVTGNPNPTPTCTKTVAPTGGPIPAFGYNPCPTPPVTPKCPLVVNGIPQPLSTDAATRAAELAACKNIKQEDFGLTVTNDVPSGFVTGTGPARFRFGRDTTISPTVDIFTQPFVGSIRVHHEALGGATVDLEACAITLSQSDLPWYNLTGTGTGLYRLLQGAGVYDLTGVFSYPTRNFSCSLPSTLTAAQAAWDLNHGGVGLPAPLDYGISVNATGWESVGPHLAVWFRPAA